MTIMKKSSVDVKMGGGLDLSSVSGRRRLGVTKKSLALVLVAFLLVFAFAGCSKGDSPSDEASDKTSDTSSDEKYPITITHAFGETVIESKPERIVSIGWGNQDVPLALGIVPVGISEANYGALEGDRLLPWTLEKIKELGGDPVVFDDTDGLDFEAINEVNPDVIIAASSGITQEEYNTLSEIAPVVAYQGEPWQTLWRDQILQDAVGIGMEEEGKQLVSDLDDRIAEAVSAYPQIKGKTAAFLYFDPSDLSTFSIYTPSDPRCAFLTDLGLTIPSSVTTLAETSDSFYLQLSAENFDKMSDVDIILTWASGDGAGMLETLQNDPLIGEIPAVKNGSIVLLAEGPIAASQTPSPLSIPWAIDEYVSLIAEAADKVQ
jgi:iron complex transport system substrate-binding protein